VEATQPAACGLVASSVPFTWLPSPTSMVPSGLTVPAWHWLHCPLLVKGAPPVSTCGWPAAEATVEAWKWQVPQAALPGAFQAGVWAVPPAPRVPPWQ